MPIYEYELSDGKGDCKPCGGPGFTVSKKLGKGEYERQ